MDTRTMAEILESTRYGKLYRVKKICGKWSICHRLRREGDRLVEVPSERATIERTGLVDLSPEIDDYAFLSHDKVWSLWAVREVGA